MNKRTVHIIGAGPAGATTGRILAENGFQVKILEKRNHIAGNCYDRYDENGALIHQYGPHYFRTNSSSLLDFLKRFSDFIPGDYFVRACVDGKKTVPMPISLATISQLKGEEYTEEMFRDYLEKERSQFDPPANAEEQCLNLFGREIYELLFKGYTEKQWGMPASSLDPSITARIPLRFNHDERYPVEKYQVMPKEGYTKLFENLLDHKNIEVSLNQECTPSDFALLKEKSLFLIYTGPIDFYFDYKYGKLGYRSLSFEYENIKKDYYQECVQINYPNSENFTRVVEIKHISKQQCSSTTICREFPQKSGDPYYPILSEENIKNYKNYKKLAEGEEKSSQPTYFIGRMAEFKYYNMDHIFLRAIGLANDLVERYK